jgi:hypothetical protein
VVNSAIIAINKNLVILSTLTPSVTISSTITGLFEIEAGSTVEFRELDIISGLSPGNTGAAFENYGILKLFNVNVFRNPFFATGQYLVFNHPNSQIVFNGTCNLQMD